MNKTISAILAGTGIFVIGCGPKIALQETFSAFDGRVIVEFHEKQGSAGGNLETEFMVFQFQDVGEYEVTYRVPEKFKDSSWWQYPEDFNISIDSGSRTVIKKFEEAWMVPSFEMTISRDNQRETYNYGDGYE